MTVFPSVRHQWGVEENVDGVIAAAFTHWDSRARRTSVPRSVVVLHRAVVALSGITRASFRTT